MPVIQTSAYNSAAYLANLVAPLLNDQNQLLFRVPPAGGVLASNFVNLIPYLNIAYRKVQRALGNINGSTFINDDVLLVVPAVPAMLQDPSYQTSITDTTAAPNTLPDDLLVPLAVWERVNLSTDDFVPVTDVSDTGGLPSQIQGDTLGMFEWRADGLYFIGATQDTQIRLRYQKGLPDLVDASSTVLIRSASEAIAFFAAAAAGTARGSAANAAKYDAAGMDALEDLIDIAVKREQRVTRRRKPYRSRPSGTLPNLL